MEQAASYCLCDAHRRSWGAGWRRRPPGRPDLLHLFPFIEFKKNNNVFFAPSSWEAKKEEGRGKITWPLGGCIQLRLSLWLHFPSNVMLDWLCLSNTPLSHLFSIRAASCIPAAACNPPTANNTTVCICVVCFITVAPKICRALGWIIHWMLLK